MPHTIFGILNDCRKGAFADFSADWHGEPIFQQQRSHLIDSGGSFDDETLTDAMSRLQCQLFMRFQRDTAHSASAISLGNGGGIVEAILARSEVGLNKLSGNNLGLEPRLLKQAPPSIANQDMPRRQPDRVGSC